MAQRYNFKFTPQTQRCIIEQLSYEYDVNLIFSEEWGNVDGVFLAPNTICIHPKTKDILETFFHELGHVHCYYNGIFPVYHDSTSKPASKQGVLSTAFRAEKWVDKWGEATCKSWFTEWQWIGSYRTEEDRQYLKKHYAGPAFEEWY